MDATYGTLAAASVLSTAGGTYQAVAAANVHHGTPVGQTTGTAYIPSAADVRHGTSVDATTGTCYVPAATVRSGISVDATTGTLAVPSATVVLTGNAIDNTTGSLTLPTASQVIAGVSFGVAGNGLTGTVSLPPQGKVQNDTSYGTAGTQFTGTIDLTCCVPSNIKNNVIIAGVTGTLVKRDRDAHALRLKHFFQERITIMANATINVVASLAGQTVPVQLSRSEDGTGLWTPSVAAGQVPTGWTKTDDSNGVAAMADGHGLVTGNQIDVFWIGRPALQHDGHRFRRQRHACRRRW